jgi:hypothetical protein
MECFKNIDEMKMSEKIKNGLYLLGFINYSNFLMR